MHRLRILVADDDPDDIALLKRAFIKAGISVPLHSVRDGQEAIDYLLGENGFSDRENYPFPSLLLLDIKMPRLNGFDVLSWLKSQPNLKRLPVLMFSSSSLRRDINHSADLGANAFLQKPHSLDDLLHLVGSIKSFWIERHHYPDCKPG
jgi:CheY-like chemotaxis protein